MQIAGTPRLREARHVVSGRVVSGRVVSSRLASGRVASVRLAWVRLASVLLAPAVVAAGLPAAARTHTPAALESTFSGNEARLKRIPPTEQYGGRGSDMVILFSRDGKLSGRFTDVGYELGDTGKWSVEGDRLCTRWRNWDGGRKRCFTIFGIRDAFAASGSDGLLGGRFKLSR